MANAAPLTAEKQPAEEQFTELFAAFTGDARGLMTEVVKALAAAPRTVFAVLVDPEEEAKYEACSLRPIAQRFPKEARALFACAGRGTLRGTCGVLGEGGLFEISESFGTNDGYKDGVTPAGRDQVLRGALKRLHDKAGGGEKLPVDFVVLYAGCYYQVQPEELRTAKGTDVDAITWTELSDPRVGTAGQPFLAGIFQLTNPEFLWEGTRFAVVREVAVDGAPLHVNYLKDYVGAQGNRAKIYLDVGTKEVGISVAGADGLPSGSPKKIKHKGTAASVVQAILENI